MRVGRIKWFFHSLTNEHGFTQLNALADEPAQAGESHADQPLLLTFFFQPLTSLTRLETLAKSDVPNPTNSPLSGHEKRENPWKH
jgi:hypothetical protein